ncbi:MAG TPA: UDP-3-O-(3-hydroxymyristoyl)glucosamine N-acyltransferase [Candidatus Binataceae bacterium]|nr:UDP-3-O-(3-hydroxymyristoyl)glucosamine N-acyltransferase [Candidatus Binataceae bacterium]
MKVKELAARLGLELRGSGEAEISTPAPLEAAAPGTIIFVASAKYLGALRTTTAGCAIVPAEFAAEAPCPVLISANPYADFARVLELFFPPYRPAPGIDPSARIASDASVGAEASIGAYCVVGAGAVIGRRAVLHPHVTIYPGARVGDDTVCHSGVSIRENVVIGERVTILNGAVIGADGFGFVEHAGGLVKIPQVGTVVIEDDVEIGANVTIDRATIGATRIARGAKLDNLVHIGHNCEVGEYSRMAAQVGLAGSVKVGRWCQFGGQSGFADHARIGDRVRVVAQSGIPHDVADDATVGGTPAVDVRTWRRVSAATPRLPAMVRRLRALERRLGIEAEEDGR